MHPARRCTLPCEIVRLRGTCRKAVSCDFNSFCFSACKIGRKVDFKSDLIEIVKRYFTTEGISFENTGDASDFAARYCEMRIRRIVPKPRCVHFSSEIHNSLGKLARETNVDKREGALEARRTVCYLRHLFVSGERVTQHLSKNVNDSSSQDGLLWDFGMHHFHLSRKLEKSGFVERSDYLLFAIVADTEVFFVDVRRHEDPEKLGWVRQDLLKIVFVNWPELTDALVLHGVSGDTLTDKEKKELRRKNINHVPNIGTQPVAPLGGGDGTLPAGVFVAEFGRINSWTKLNYMKNTSIASLQNYGLGWRTRVSIFPAIWSFSWSHWTASINQTN